MQELFLFEKFVYLQENKKMGAHKDCQEKDYLAIVDNIIKMIADEGISLRKARVRVGGISWGKLYDILDSDAERAKQYARAAKIRGLEIFEEIIDIADDSEGDTRTIVKDGEEVEIVNQDNIQRSKLRVDARKWTAARMNAKKYSDEGVALEARRIEDASDDGFLSTTISLRDSIIDKHYRHFQSGHDWTILEGGSRSGKSFNLIKSAYLRTRYEKFDCSLIAPSHKMLEFGMFSDLKKILQEYAPKIHIPERPTKINLHGSIWNFEVVVSENEAKRNRDNVIVDEADGIPEIVGNLLGRATGRKFIAFNPVKKFWAHDKINEAGTNIMRSTWQDNPFLSENQLQWFADLKKKGEFAEEGSPESYAYKVYYLGEYSLLSGKAYELSDFDIVDEVPDKYDYFISYSDPSLGVGADYFASLLFGIKNKQVYALDCIFSQFTKTGGFVEQLKVWDKFTNNMCDHYAEKNGTSGVVTKAAKELYDGSLHEVSNGDKKEADIIVYSTTAKSFKYKRGGKMLEFIQQCVDFPNAENDDAPDCLARGAKIILKNFDIV